VLRARLRRLVEDWLPWYDHDAEAKRSARTEAIRSALDRGAPRGRARHRRQRSDPRAYLRYADGVERR
jgi:hypothetical protein